MDSTRDIPTLAGPWCPLLFGAVCLIGSSAIAQEESLDFVRDVRPILSETCFHCHGPDSETREADLRLDLRDSAASVLEGSDADEIELLRRILSDDPDQRMPPPGARKQLNQSQQEVLRQWALGGGEYEKHWSLRKPQRPHVPTTENDDWCRNSIDRFVLKELEDVGLQPAPRASLTTLIRRLHMDLVGLPPSVAAVERLILRAEQIGEERTLDELQEQLMASRHYGEHMALPWLEAARYADTDGYQNDRYRYQHAWRDWVIRAFNDKMSYRQFVIEQLGGDLLPNPSLWQQVATGFGRNHRINSEDGSIPEEWRVENVVDRVDTFGTVFLGLTVGCARCHDHKYDPISQKEYYQLFAYFNNIAEHGVGPNNGNSPPFVELPKSWPLLSDEEDRALTPDPVELKPARKEAGNGLLRPQAGSPKTVMVMHELAEPRATYRLIRGQYNMKDKSEPLEPNLPLALLPSETQSETLSHEPRGNAPRDRLELAHWLVGGNNPLTARVAVNRIWQQFFGMGLVESSDNFGSQGTLPSHPELLDWLAVEFQQSGWDMQHIQRLISQSATYRQASKTTLELREHDPQNRLLARGPRVRLQAFALRDQALAAAGLLVSKTGGESTKPYMPEKIWSAISNNKYKEDEGENLFRRSLYTYWRRTIPPPTMMNFNAAAREVCSVKTEVTNTPLQALTLLNNKTFVEAARGLAERMSEVATCSEDRIVYGFRCVTSRMPTSSELNLLGGVYQTALSNFEEDQDAAQQLIDIGESPVGSDLPVARLAALTVVASVLLNLDEAITKE